LHLRTRQASIARNFLLPDESEIFPLSLFELKVLRCIFFYFFSFCLSVSYFFFSSSFTDSSFSSLSFEFSPPFAFPFLHWVTLFFFFSLESTPFYFLLRLWHEPTIYLSPDFNPFPQNRHVRILFFLHSRPLEVGHLFLEPSPTSNSFRVLDTPSPPSPLPLFTALNQHEFDDYRMLFGPKILDYGYPSPFLPPW